MGFLFFLSEVTDPVYNTSAVSFNRMLRDRAKLDIRRGSSPICAGKSLSAIKKGLESSSHHSVILVFTDAPPSDDSLLPEIIEKVAETSSKVMFCTKLVLD